MLLVLLLSLSVVLSFASEPQNKENLKAYDPTVFLNYLKNNKQIQCAAYPTQPRMPLSFYVESSYWDGIPLNERVPNERNYTQPTVVPACKNTIVQPDLLNSYEFESERYLTMVGLNIYDGAVHSIASALLGDVDDAYNYQAYIIGGGKTCQFPDIRGDAPCKGAIDLGECTDPNQAGACGFCYGSGSNADRTMPKANAWLFRLISDYWLLQGTVDARCPTLGVQWTWNDYRPILGENSWAQLTGPLQVALIKFGSVTAIPDGDISITTAINFVTGLPKMVTSVGAVGYSPKNTLGYLNVDSGFDVSTENNVSLYAGLKMLRYILTQKNIHPEIVTIIDTITGGIMSYVKSAYDPTVGYFRQGGTYSNVTGQFAWHTGDAGFAVDCQTWTMSVIGPKTVDAWFGANTAANIWLTTKKLGGYNYLDWAQSVDGLGYSINSDAEVFSGEWSFGAINMLRIFSQAYNNSAYATEGSGIRDNISQQITNSITVNGTLYTGVNYANKRYWIPFGWWANPILSTASTSWAVFADKGFNPFYLGGQYLTDY